MRRARLAIAMWGVCALKCRFTQLFYPYLHLCTNRTALHNYGILSSMRRIERNEERGKSELGWLSSRFSYSFSEYLNPRRMNFGVLRVFNHDTINPSSGFPMHHHEQMEIVTIMLGGALTHEDSMGNKEELKKDEVQVMTAGTGINHSEWNNDAMNKVQLLQIWMYPKDRALLPRYEQHRFDESGRKDHFQLLVSGIKKEEALYIHQDAAFSRANLLEVGKPITYTLTNRTNGVFIYVISGGVTIGADSLATGDSMEVTDEISFTVVSLVTTDILVIEAPRD